MKNILIHWKRDDSGSPLYIQLYKYIKGAIQNGIIEPGPGLPSIREMSRLTGLGKNTVISAVALLADNGYIETKQKNKTIVKLHKDKPSSPDWYEYMKKSNLSKPEDSYRATSVLRSKSNIINLFDTRFGQDFFPETLIKKAVAKAAKRMNDLYHQSYFNYKGIKWVREAVCEYLRRYNIYVDSSQVLMTRGLGNVTPLLTQGLLAPGADVFLPAPNNMFATRVFASAGMKVYNIPQDSEGVVPDRFAAKAKKGSGLLYMHSFDSWPSNVVMSEERIKKIMNICVVRRIPVVECDTMRTCSVEPAPSLPMKSFDRTDNVIYIFCPTRHILPGLRATATVAPEIVVNRLAETQYQSEQMQDYVSQLLLGEMISGGALDEYMDAVRPLLAERRAEAVKLMHKYLDGLATWDERPYGINFWVELDKRLDVTELHLERSNVVVYPGRACGVEFKHGMRICYAGVSIKQFEYALIVISNAIHNANKSLV